MSADLGPGARTRVRRLPEKARYDEATIFSILDATPVCHVATTVEGHAVALPTLHVREGNILYLHGSQSNAVLRAVRDEQRACVTVTIYDGLRVARSGFESSAAYRSVVIFGAAREVPESEATPILDRFVDAILPGRASEVRAMTEREARLTLVLAVTIDEASAKVSAGPTDDDETDQELDVWSGVVPARLVHAAPIPSTDGRMAREELAVPPSVRRLVSSTVPPATARVLQQIADIVPVDLRERVSINALRDRLTWGDDPFRESTSPWHVTASAFVVSPRGVILHKHRLLGIWVQPGGHVDPGESPEDGARREVYEETGLLTEPFGDGRIFHVDVHRGPRGHTHYDLRYVLWNDGDEPSPGANESPDVEWLSFPDAVARAEFALRPALEHLAEVVGPTDVGH